MAADVETRVSQPFTVRFDAGTTGLTPGVKVVSEAGAVVVARATGFTEDSDTPGLYVKTDVAAPSIAGTYTIAVDDGEVSPSYAYLELLVRPVGSFLDVPEGFPTLDDILDASDVTELTEATEGAQQSWYAISRRLIEQFTGQTFGLDEDLTIAVDSNGGSRLPLPRRLASITGLSATGTSFDEEDVAISPDRDSISLGSVSGSTWVEKVLNDEWREFPMGIGTVSITGDWGWTPEELAATPLLLAMKLDMEAQALASASGLFGTVRAAGRMGVTSVSEGPLRADVERPETMLSPDAAALLEDYVWQPAPVIA